MALTELLEAFSAAGHRVNEQQGTIDGVTHGIAWRLVPADGTLDMSLSISEENLQKWQGTLTGGATVAYHAHGVRLTAVGVADMTGTDALAYVDGWTAYAEGAAGASFDNSFQSYREPISTYLRGAGGALLGALVGVIPWLLVGLMGYQLWLLGAFISIASFYGYQLARGAHATRFAVTCIVVSSLLAVLAGQVVDTALAISMAAEATLSFGQALQFCLTPTGLIMVGSSSFWPLLMCALGFVGIRSKVMAYTHESNFLRRRK